VSIESVGFSAFDTIFPQSMVRITIAENSSFDLLNQFSKGAAETVYNSLWPVARIIPTTRLAVVAGDKAAVIDANVKEEMQGSTLLNRLEQLGSRFACVARVELLDDVARQESLSDDGNNARAEATAAAKAAANDSGVLASARHLLDNLGTVGKYLALGLGAVAVIYLVHKLKD
jgi:hypothetical protein